MTCPVTTFRSGVEPSSVHPPLSLERRCQQVSRKVRSRSRARPQERQGLQGTTAAILPQGTRAVGTTRWLIWQVFSTEAVRTASPRRRRPPRLPIPGPFGLAFLRPASVNQLVLIASGTGFAPIWSIAVAAIREHQDRHIVMVVGARTERSPVAWKCLLTTGRAGSDCCRGSTARLESMTLKSFYFIPRSRALFELVHRTDRAFARARSRWDRRDSISGSC